MEFNNNGELIGEDGNNYRLHPFTVLQILLMKQHNLSINRQSKLKRTTDFNKVKELNKLLLIDNNKNNIGDN